MTLFTNRGYNCSKCLTDGVNCQMALLSPIRNFQSVTDINRQVVSACTQFYLQEISIE